MQPGDFATTAIDNWDFFLPKSHKNQPIETQQYRIFEPQWKQTILSWFGRENVPKEEKEAFIQALVNFEDGCVQYEGKGFYGYRAYFLAAAAIAKFPECEKADKIVQQLVHWKLDYYRFNSIEEQVTTGLQETERTKAIDASVQLINTLQQNFTLFIAITSLETIGHGNEKAISALIQLLDTSDDKDIRRRVVKSLGKLGSGDEKAISVLVNIINTSEHDDIRKQAIASLGEIGSGNEQAISVLAKLLNTSKNESIDWQVAESLSKIGADNETAIDALVELLDTSRNKYTRFLAGYRLGKVDNEHEKAIILRATKKPEKIETDNEKAISDLIQLLATSEDEDTLSQAVYTLGEIGTGDEKAIAALVQLLNTSENESILVQVAESLGNIDHGNEKAISVLLQLIDTSENDETIVYALESLGNIGMNNEKAISALVQLLDKSQNEYTHKLAAKSLGKIVTSNKDISLVVQALRRYKLDSEDYDLIWNCAQNMPYPEFYQAWYHS